MALSLPFWAQAGLSTIAGLLAVTGWAPLAWWPFSLLAYSILIGLVSGTRSLKKSFILGFFFGLSLHLAGNTWAYTALHHHAGMPGFSALFGLLFFATYLALFTALPCALITLLLRAQSTKNVHSTQSIQAVQPALPVHKAGSKATPALLKNALLIGALLSLGEWARSLLFNGFTSLSLGYALIDTWLAGYAPLLGVYGVSFIGFFLSSLLALLYTCHLKTANTVHYTAIMIPIALFLSGWGLLHISWTTPSEPPLSYRLIQANIPQEAKFDPAGLQHQFDHYLTQIEATPADLIITPETAFPVFLNELPATTLARLQRFSQRTHSHVLLGIATTDFNGHGFNSLLHINPATLQLASYQKVRLMPFGEYSPSGFRWFTNSLAIPFKDLSAGSIKQAPLLVKNQKIAPLICHEDSNGNELRQWLPEAALLVMPSNLGWFKESWFIEQNLQIVRFRALESGRPVLRVANTGITAHINPDGGISQYLPVAKTGVLAGTIQPMKGLTPYGKAGDFSFLFLALLALLPALKLLTHINKLPKIHSR